MSQVEVMGNKFSIQHFNVYLDCHVNIPISVLKAFTVDCISFLEV